MPKLPLCVIIEEMRAALMLIVLMIAGCSKDSENPDIKYISFGQPHRVNIIDYDDHKIENITGFAEAPTISPDDRIIYYHKKGNEKHVLYMIRKK